MSMRLDLSTEWDVRFEGLAVGPDQHMLVMRQTAGWLQADLPCDVRMPLLENGIIEEPLEAENFRSSRWVEEKSWWFRKQFSVDDALMSREIVELELPGIDACGDVFMNGVPLGRQSNAHYPFVRSVKEFLRPGSNELVVRVTTGTEQLSDEDIAELKPYISAEAAADRGDKRRAYIRKPQYVFGWDWGPRVATCGITGIPSLRAYNQVAVRHVSAVTKRAASSAELAFSVEVENLHPYQTREGTVTVELVRDGKTKAVYSRQELLCSGVNFVDFSEVLEHAELWWPNGWGDQPLYTVKVTAATDQGKDSYPEFSFGIRTIRWDQTPLGSGQRQFSLYVNETPVFCRGANWIPADSIYPRVSEEKYDRLLSEAQEANFTMLRIWGGGIYETDAFFRLCDEKGILIWQDFMFSCAMYPDNQDWFLQDVEKELDYQTRRLQTHPCLVLWCGNNENHWGFDQWWGDDVPFYGGAVIYNRLAPRVVRRNCPEIPYWNSSPYGGQDPNGSELGDRHHWHDCTMNEEMAKRISPEEYDKVSAKFVSEYGYIGPCCLSSIKAYHGEHAVDKNGHIWKLHNNTFEKATVPAGVRKHYRDPETLGIDEYILYAGLTQGLMLGYSLEAIRAKPFCHGALFWMYNDCWGEVGWSIVDYYLRRKPAYYFVKRAFAPLKFIMRRNDADEVIVIGINDTRVERQFSLRYGYTSFDGTDTSTALTPVFLSAGAREIVLRFRLGTQSAQRGIYYVQPEESEVPGATLRLADFRELTMPEPQLRVSEIQLENSVAVVQVTADTYAHAVHFPLGIDGDDIRWSDAYFDLLPGETRTVRAENLPAGLTAADFRPRCVLPV